MAAIALGGTALYLSHRNGQQQTDLRVVTDDLKQRLSALAGQQEASVRELSQKTDAASQAVRGAAAESTLIRSELQRVTMAQSGLTPKVDAAIEQARTLQLRIPQMVQEDLNLRADLQRLAAQSAVVTGRLDGVEAQVRGLQLQTAAISNRMARASVSPLRASPDVAGPASGRSHTVKQGDTLDELAHKYGTSVEALKRANPGVDPMRLQIGQRLRLP